MKYLIIHHSASNTDDFASIKAYHVKTLHYIDISYNDVVERSGKHVIGRSLLFAGAHTLGLNINSIGICLCGNFDINEPNDKQKATLKSLVNKYKSKYPKIKLIYHSEAPKQPDFTATPYITSCCGKMLKKFVETLR